MKKRLIKIIFITIIALIFLYLAAFAFLSLKGKGIIVEKLKSATQKNVTIGYLGIIPPFTLQLNNLEIKDLVKADSLYISPSILGLMSGNLVFNEISMVKPEFTYERSLPEPGRSSDTAQVPLVTKEIPAAAPPLLFKRLIIKDGKVHFIDRTVSAEGIKINVESIFFTINNFYSFARPTNAKFDLKAKIPWQEDGEVGKIEAEGWLNLFKKDIQATLKITDIDGIYLFPYYSNWVDLEKARIEKAKLNFNCNIQGTNNEITAPCHLELTDIVRKPLPPEASEEKAAKITDAVLDIFRALNQGKIVLDFTIKTKMDRPEFGFGDIRMAFEDKIIHGRKSNIFDPQYILNMPGKLLENVVRGANYLSRAVVDGAVAVGTEIKKRAEDTFKKEKEEK